VVDIRNVITCFKFGDDRFRGLASAEGQILLFPIDFDSRPYNTLTLPCERVIYTQNLRMFTSLFLSSSEPLQTSSLNRFSRLIRHLTRICAR